ncbi:MAG: hypothetical protein ACT4RN_13590 [Pseudonocardia sp.]
MSMIKSWMTATMLAVLVSGALAGCGGGTARTVGGAVDELGRPIIGAADDAGRVLQGVTAVQARVDAAVAAQTSGLSSIDRQRVAELACYANDTLETSRAKTFEQGVSQAFLALSGSPGLRPRVLNLVAEVRAAKSDLETGRKIVVAGSCEIVGARSR